MRAIRLNVQCRLHGHDFPDDGKNTAGQRQKTGKCKRCNKLHRKSPRG